MPAGADDRFDQIAASMLSQDPQFGLRAERRGRLAAAATRTLGSAAAVATGLAALPLSIEFGLYPVGIAGFLLAAIALARSLRPAPRRAPRGVGLVPQTRPGEVGSGGATVLVGTFRLGWQFAVLAVASLLVVATIMAAPRGPDVRVGSAGTGNPAGVAGETDGPVADGTT